MSGSSDLQAKTRSAGENIFIAAALLIAVLLLSQLTGQTVWVDDAKSFAAQPRFWPAVALVAMVASLAMHFWFVRRRKPQSRDWMEARRWIEPLEFAIWFMVFVFLVPYVGFLPMSIAFAVALTRRLGYRDRRFVLLAALFAIITVILFKGLLGVKIPGAMIYEMLPGSIRNFFILYL